VKNPTSMENRALIPSINIITLYFLSARMRALDLDI
jgi:hypothetical protein